MTKKHIIKNITILTSNVDSDNDKFDIENIDIPETLPVYFDFRHKPEFKVGDCSLRKENNCIVCDIDSTFPLSEIEMLYPAIAFEMIDKQIYLNEDEAVWQIDNIKLLSLGLCQLRNSDKSILRIKDQIKENKY